MADPRDDLLVNIASESPLSKAGVEQPSSGPGGVKGPVAKAKDWVTRSQRNKWIAGGALATLLLIPTVVVPAAVVGSKQQQKRRATRVPDWGAYRTVGSKSVYLDPLVRFRVVV
jgi:hypothetical protein